jgi:hypothetical protein
MADVDTEIRALLRRAADLPVADPPATLRSDAAAARGRRNVRWQLAGVCAAVAGLVIAAVVVAQSEGTSTGRTTVPPTPVGPTSHDLEGGHWVAIPPAPIKACSPTVVPTGSGAFVLETGLNHSCPPAAALYDTTTQSWTKIASPPPLVSANPVATWGHGELAMISDRTGAAWQWSPSSGRWTSLPAIPDIATGTGISFQVSSAAWVGGRLMVAAIDDGRTHLYDEESTSSVRLVVPVPPAGGAAVGAQITSFDGHVVLAQQVQVRRSNHVEILRLSDDRWTLLRSSLGRLRGIEGHDYPSGFSSLTDGLLLVGDECPGGCAEDIVRATIVQPGPTAASTTIQPLRLHNNFYTVSALASGGSTVAAVYPEGIQHLPPSNRLQRTRGLTDLYDTATRRWQTGPRLPLTSRSGFPLRSVWTSNGVLFLADGEPGVGGPRLISGWLLEPR